MIGLYGDVSGKRTPFSISLCTLGGGNHKDFSVLCCFFSPDLTCEGFLFLMYLLLTIPLPHGLRPLLSLRVSVPLPAMLGLINGVSFGQVGLESNPRFVDFSR